jgi:hypothetical protein
MKKRFQAAVLATVAAAGLFGVTPVSADQPTYVCTNIQPDPDPNLRNFITHSRTIAAFAEATGIYECGL